MSTMDSAPTSPHVVTAEGDLDVGNLAPLEARLRAAIAASPAVILDVGAVTFADSSFLNLLLRTHQNADLRIVGLHPPLDRLFQLVGVDGVLNVFPTVDEARASSR
ncbi:STAS domain-containing protein [Actinacidiphila alni]|nr:STAS domain-containing protein [Actinacidiphila alni]